MPLVVSKGNANQPELRVEIAFVSNPYSSSLTWTDVTHWVDAVDTTRGRNYERGNTEAGTCTVTLRNLDGRFDPTNTASPYYPYVLPYRPVRVSASYGGVYYPVWYGFVERWPQVWSALGGMKGTISLTAVDGMKTVLSLNYGASFFSVLAADAPFDFFEFASGATGTDVGSNSGTPLTSLLNGTAPVATTGLVGGTDGFGAAITPTQCNYATSLTPYNTASWAYPWGFECWFEVTSAGTGTPRQLEYVQGFFFNTTSMMAATVLVSSTTASSGYAVALAYKQTSGAVQYDVGPDLAMGSIYHLAVVVSSGTVGGMVLYVNGVATVTSTIAQSATTPPVSSGNYHVIAGPHAPTNWTPETGFAATIDEAALWTQGYGATAIGNHYQAGANPQLVASYPQQDSGARVSAVLTTASWPTSMRSIDTGNSTLIAATSLSGSSALSLVQQAAADELGDVFVNAAGSFVFTNRAHRNSASSSATFGDGAGEFPYQNDIEIDFDDQYVYNYVAVTQGGTTPAYTAVAQDMTSQAQYGVRQLNVTANLVNAADARGMAATLLAWYANPRARVGTLTLSGRGLPTNYPQMLGREIGDLVTIKRRPPQAPAISLPCFVDGVQHKITPTTWTTTFLLTPQLPNATY